MQWTKEQLIAYDAFLWSEEIRHQEDIYAIQKKRDILRLGGYQADEPGPWITEQEIIDNRDQEVMNDVLGVFRFTKDVYHTSMEDEMEDEYERWRKAFRESEEARIKRAEEEAHKQVKMPVYDNIEYLAGV